MPLINLVVEDELSAAISRKILTDCGKVAGQRFPDLNRSQASGGIGYIKQKIMGFNQAARVSPYFILVDLDTHQCASALIEDFLPITKHHPNLIFRVAVREVESWVMADRKNFSEYTGISIQKIPLNPDEIREPKEFLINLVRKSGKKNLKAALVPKQGSTARIGRAYNSTLSGFIYSLWNCKTASSHSPSLARALQALAGFKPHCCPD